VQADALSKQQVSAQVSEKAWAPVSADELEQALQHAAAQERQRSAAVQPRVLRMRENPHLPCPLQPLDVLHERVERDGHRDGHGISFRWEPEYPEPHSGREVLPDCRVVHPANHSPQEYSPALPV
jgi:hypothetical protein